jgi:hypothetical protein
MGDFTKYTGLQAFTGLDRVCVGQWQGANVNPPWATHTAAVAQISPVRVSTIAAMRALALAATFPGLPAAGTPTPLSMSFYLSGYYAEGDGGGDRVFRYDPTDTTTADNGGTVIVDSSGARLKQIDLGFLTSVKWFGAAPAQSAATNTTAINAAIALTNGQNMAGSVSAGAVNVRGFVWFPAGGTLAINPITINRPTNLGGVSQWGSQLSLASGNTSPAFTIAVAYDSVNYPAIGPTPPADVVFKDLMITSPNRADASGANVAHGIQLSQDGTKPVYTRITLDNIAVYNMPADGLNGQTFGSNGFVLARNCFFKANGRDNFSANSNYDWRVYDCDFGLPVHDNIVMSGCGGHVFQGCNIYSAGRYNLNLFQGTSALGLNSFIGCAIDTAQQHGISYNCIAGSPWRFIGCTINQNGQQTSATYSDFAMLAGGNGDVRFTDCDFRGPNNVDGAFPALWNIQLPSAVSIEWSGCTFEGPIASCVNLPHQCVGPIQARFVGDQQILTSPFVISAPLSTGSAEAGLIILWAQITVGSPSLQLTRDGLAPSATNGLILPVGGIMRYSISMFAENTNGTDCAIWDQTPGKLIRRPTTAASTVLVGGGYTLTLGDNNGTSGAVWTATVAADTTFGGLNITANKNAATNGGYFQAFVTFHQNFGT